MKTIPFNAGSLKKMITVLKKGGVIAHPADTCFGLTGDLMNPEVYKKIQKIKGRDYKNPMSIMISVVEQIKINNYVKIDDFSSFITYKLFPGAVTLVMPKGPNIPKYYFPDLKTIGLRVPLHNLTQDVLTAFGGPLITTSANPSGLDLCFSHKEVMESFKDSEYKPDLIIEGKTNHYDLASTVIGVEKDHVKIIRKGPVTKSQLEGILGVEVKE